MRILTPEGNRVVDADAVWLPGSAGAFEVLDGHAPLISTLEAGEVRWRLSGGQQEETFQIRCGVVRVERNQLQLCVEAA